jgi:hypothetical protein
MAGRAVRFDVGRACRFIMVETQVGSMKKVEARCAEQLCSSEEESMVRQSTDNLANSHS